MRTWVAIKRWRTLSDQRHSELTSIYLTELGRWISLVGTSMERLTEQFNLFARSCSPSSIPAPSPVRIRLTDGYGGPNPDFARQLLEAQLAHRSIFIGPPLRGE